MSALVDLLVVRGLRISFGTAERVRGADLTLAAGRCLGVVGESGSGKSLTALAIAGLLPPAAIARGSIAISGREMCGAPEAAWRRLRGDHIGFVFQEAIGSLDPLIRIRDQVAEAAQAHGHADPADRAAAMLAEVGLTAAQGNAYPHQLSGGQQQRAMIAAALVANPALLVADEPTTALDATVQAQVLDLLDGLRRRRGLAMLFISHDLGVVARMADDIAVMFGGEVVEHGPAADILHAATHPHTRALVASSRRQPPRAAPAHPAATLGPPALDVRDVVVTFAGAAGRRVRALDGLSLTLPPGGALGLVGESGSGKSTLAALAVGLLTPAAGHLRVFGADPAASGRVARDAQMVFQDAGGSLNPRLRIADSLAEPFLVHRLCSRPDIAARSAALLAEVGLDAALLLRYPHQLSGGQRQRVAIARALAVEPRLLVCDEPVSALDATVAARILTLLDGIRRARGLALLFISHDLGAVAAICDDVAVLKDGRLVEAGRAADVLGAPATAYTQALVAAIPRIPAARGAITPPAAALHPTH